MPLATSYTEDGLKTFMAAQLLSTADVLDWESTAHAAYDAALTRTLRAYGAIADVDEATDMPRLEALARREIWRAVADVTVGAVDFTSGEEGVKRAQLHDHAV